MMKNRSYPLPKLTAGLMVGGMTLVASLLPGLAVVQASSSQAPSQPLSSPVLASGTAILAQTPGRNFACSAPSYFAQVLWRNGQPTMTTGRNPSQPTIRSAPATVSSSFGNTIYTAFQQGGNRTDLLLFGTTDCAIVVSNAAGETTINQFGRVTTGTIVPPTGIAQPRLLGATRLVSLGPLGQLLGFTSADQINVTSCSPRVSAIQLRARNANVNITRAVVTFRNGQKADLDVRSQINKGQGTRWISLPGSERCVTSIYVVGNTLPGQSQQGRIEFWGR